MSTGRCDVLVDYEEAFATSPIEGMAIWRDRPFLDAAHSPGWSRALYIPYLSKKRNTFARYVVRRRGTAK